MLISVIFIHNMCMYVCVYVCMYVCMYVCICIPGKHCIEPTCQDNINATVRCTLCTHYTSHAQNSTTTAQSSSTCTISAHKTNTQTTTMLASKLRFFIQRSHKAKKPQRKKHSLNRQHNPLHITNKQTNQQTKTPLTFTVK